MRTSQQINKLSSGYRLAEPPIGVAVIQRDSDVIFNFSMDVDSAKELGEIISFAIGKGFDISQELNEVLAISDLINTTRGVRNG